MSRVNVSTGVEKTSSLIVTLVFLVSMAWLPRTTKATAARWPFVDTTKLSTSTWLGLFLLQAAKDVHNFISVAVEQIYILIWSATLII